jgi:hypothetical protein
VEGIKEGPDFQAMGIRGRDEGRPELSATGIRGGDRGRPTLSAIGKYVERVEESPILNVVDK